MPPTAQVYVVTVAGEMDPGLREAFADFDVAVGQGVTRVDVRRSDAAVLHGVLHRIEGLGLELLDVQPVDASPPSP